MNIKQSYAGRLTATLLLTLSLNASVMASEADEHRQHDAHEHGHAVLNLVQENSTVQLMLESPAANIVGFENYPKNAEEQRKVKEAIALLKQGEQLFVFDAEAQCVQQSVEVETELADNGHDESSETHESHESHEGHEGHEGHAEFTASYLFTCDKPTALNRLTVKVFELFPHTEEIDGQLVTDKHQLGVELSAKQPSINFN